MSMIRLTFQVTPFDTEPTSPQFAGVQGSHQAVEVLFKLDDRLYDPSYRYPGWNFWMGQGLQIPAICLLRIHRQIPTREPFPFCCRMVGLKPEAAVKFGWQSRG